MLDAYKTPDRLLARIALHERFGNTTFDLHSWVLDLLLERGEGVRPADGTLKVLEVGAGTGRFWEVNAARLPSSWQLTLTDASPGMLPVLKETLRGAGLNADVLLADATALPFENGSFDIAFANHVLYHVADLKAAIKELRRVLRPGGLLVAATNGEAHMQQVKELAEPLGGLDGLVLPALKPLSFTCESGLPFLKAEFDTVELNRHDDALLVTSHEPLLAYLRSLVHLEEEAPGGTLAALREWELELDAAPLPLKIDRATGVFVAH